MISYASLACSLAVLAPAVAWRVLQKPAESTASETPHQASESGSVPPDIAFLVEYLQGLNEPLEQSLLIEKRSLDTVTGDVGKGALTLVRSWAQEVFEGQPPSYTEALTRFQAWQSTPASVEAQETKTWMWLHSKQTASARMQETNGEDVLTTAQLLNEDVLADFQGSRDHVTVWERKPSHESVFVDADYHVYPLTASDGFRDWLENHLSWRESSYGENRVWVGSSENSKRRIGLVYRAAEGKLPIAVIYETPSSRGRGGLEYILTFFRRSSPLAEMRAPLQFLEAVTFDTKGAWPRLDMKRTIVYRGSHLEGTELESEVRLPVKLSEQTNLTEFRVGEQYDYHEGFESWPQDVLDLIEKRE